MSKTSLDAIKNALKVGQSSAELESISDLCDLPWPKGRTMPTENVSNAAYDVLAERQRQVEIEGWTEKHDDEYEPGDLAIAGACYAAYALAEDGRTGIHGLFAFVKNSWPWGDEWWKPKEPRRDLVRAAALIIAEIERIDRAEKDSK